jgi:hypothetical protein
VNRKSKIKVSSRRHSGKAPHFRFPAFCRKQQRRCCGRLIICYIKRVKSLTKQEQLFLCIVLGLLLTGWAVKTWRTAHPPAAATRQAKP